MFLFRLFGRRRRTKNTFGPKTVSHQDPATENSHPETKPVEVNTAKFMIRELFAQHMAKYEGQTVTIFVSGGGPSGKGFTGILLNVNSAYIRLLAYPGPVPYCTLSLFDKKNAFPGYTLSPVHTLGCVVNIPTYRIASFVHNTI
ncbi:MAG: hypothetical protein N2645_21610 [Clostridia bacterium]|nr:hypothetical protein [Clostridia bacterium]